MTKKLYTALVNVTYATEVYVEAEDEDEAHSKLCGGMWSDEDPIGALDWTEPKFLKRKE